MSPSISSILKKCSIYYDDALISGEVILDKYLDFFANCVESDSCKIGLVLHTGSVCFDAISVVAAGLGCLTYNISTNDDIISALQPGEMVMFKGQRYRWNGLKRIKDLMYIALEQDGSGKNGVSTTLLPYDKNKHLIAPYYGDSKTTDGRGVKLLPTNREDFLSHVFDMPLSEIPTQIDVSVVIVSDRAFFADISRRVSIEYGDGKRVGLLDIAPASFYTASGTYQFGTNPTKSEPVFKVTSNLSTARDLVLDKNGNKVVGLLLADNSTLTPEASELSDLLRRKTIKYAFLTTPMRSALWEKLFEQYEDVSVFACTRRFLSQIPKGVKHSNRYTKELSDQIQMVQNNTITQIRVEGGISKEAYRSIRNALLAIKQSDEADELKDEFILTAQGLLNLFNTAVFSMEAMENAISEGRLPPSVLSPKVRIQTLWKLAEKATKTQDRCIFVADALEQQYAATQTKSAKLEALLHCVEQYTSTDIAIIIPKAYYYDILTHEYPSVFKRANILCATPSRFEAEKMYSAIIVLGEINTKRFDPLNCISSPNIMVLLYNCEEISFAYRKKKKEKYEAVLNMKGGIASETDQAIVDQSIETDEDREMQRFSSLDEYVESHNIFDVRRISGSVGNQSSDHTQTSEVTHIGIFATGEEIFFSKYYCAVVFDSANGSISEKTPELLAPGDVLVFTKVNDYTRNIVDIIYFRLLKSGRLSAQSMDMFEKSQYWKEALREYKSVNKLSYRDLTRELRKAGCSLQEVTVRQWLVDESHIVGPRKEDTMQFIAELTKDAYLLSDFRGYFEACRHVRGERRKILGLIAQAIHNKLMGLLPEPGSIFEIVFDNVGNLSETMELEDISELSESAYININLVNRPITETEVLL